MRKRILSAAFLIATPSLVFAQCPAHAIKVTSWNIRALGQSKDAAEIAVIAEFIEDSDIVALQEVVAGEGGPEAVSRLWQQPQTADPSWRQRVSDSTSGEGTERYAFLWRAGGVELTGAALSEDLQYPLDREPYIGWFAVNHEVLTVVNLHAVSTAKDPANGIFQLPEGPSIKNSPQALVIWRWLI